MLFISQNLHEHTKEPDQQTEAAKEVIDLEDEEPELRINIIPKKAHSQHLKLIDVKMNKTTKSAHMLGDGLRDSMGVVSSSFDQMNLNKRIDVGSSRLHQSKLNRIL